MSYRIFPAVEHASECYKSDVSSPSDVAHTNPGKDWHFVTAQVSGTNLKTEERESIESGTTWQYLVMEVVVKKTRSEEMMFSKRPLMHRCVGCKQPIGSVSTCKGTKAYPSGPLALLLNLLAL